MTINNSFIKKIFSRIKNYYLSFYNGLIKQNSDLRKINWPYSTYLVNEKHKLIYCPIPKVACSSFKKIIFLYSDLYDKEKNNQNLKGSDFHIFMSRNFSLSKYTFEEAQKKLQSEQYMKFTIVRNPWSRLVSAYIDKFVRVTPEKLDKFTLAIINPVIESVYKSKGLKPDYNQSINFHQFVEYVSSVEDEKLNEHWKPQYLFLGDTQFDLIGKLENIEKDFQPLKQRIDDSSLNLPLFNQTHYSSKQLEKSKNYSFMYPKQLRTSSKFPHYQNYYTSYLYELVKEKYKKDIEYFGYNYETI